MEIAILKKRVKKLEKRKRSRTQGLKLFKIGTSKRRSLDKEDASKHGRNLNARLISEEDDFDDGFDVGLGMKMSETSKAKSIVFEDVEESAKEQREGKAPMVEEDVPPPKKTQKQLDDERARLEEAMRLQAEQEAEHAELIHLDRLLAQRMQEEEEMTEQQKKRQAEICFLGENETGENIAQQRMVNLLNQRKKFFAEQRAQARRNRPMTQTQQRTYMSNYLKHQGSWTSAQLKKLSDEEIKAKYERLVRSIANFVPMGAEERVKRLGPELQSDTSKKYKKDYEVKGGSSYWEHGKRKLGQSMARKRKLGQSTAKEDEEYEKEKEELSMFFIIAFDEHKEVDYEILDQRLTLKGNSHDKLRKKYPLHEESVVADVGVENWKVKDDSTMASGAY
ncbi:hypothetical protein Tco_0705325 [Tanacetum coccineum]|uniref:Uncharacterized protein n=1 Tax=Tanacetum coccineum TaxID=301880 RepID=A0ABQ4Y4H4_9ASTR